MILFLNKLGDKKRQRMSLSTKTMYWIKWDIIYVFIISSYKPFSKTGILCSYAEKN